MCRLEPEVSNYWFLRGALWEELSTNEHAMLESIRSYTEATCLDPENLSAQLANDFCFLKQNRSWSAIEQIEYVIELSPDLATGELLGALSFAYVADGRIEARLSFLEHIVETKKQKEPAILCQTH